MTALQEHLQKFGTIGSTERLREIAMLKLGKRSEAAKRALESRNRRKELMESGHDFETTRLIVNRENQ